MTETEALIEIRRVLDLIPESTPEQVVKAVEQLQNQWNKVSYEDDES